MEKIVGKIKGATIEELKKHGWKEQEINFEDMKWGHTRFMHPDSMDTIYANESYAMHNHKFFIKIKKSFRNACGGKK